jgi:hypothetical protein
MAAADLLPPLRTSRAFRWAVGVGLGVVAALSLVLLFMLAQATGSELIVGELQHLVSRTSMLVALFEPARAMRCACEEHGDILSALSAGDSSRAMKAMQQHLALIETRLRPNAEQPSGDAVEVIRADWAALQAAPHPASGLAAKVRR